MTVTTAVVGSGARGQIYARAAAAGGRARIAADPDPARRAAPAGALSGHLVVRAAERARATRTVRAL
ncbi:MULTISPECIES: hypothetical protein [Streptosporangium]|uniref:Threonine dehydrogenase-like Zn-dependent dehydrogenase n=1 Tax=Streptosporangium brasiliense TaxID=47480 RepID=A0ABT9RK76_9ACTN|nr:hypothetical protein [Streptosporangium brasiliense]MDP9869701.1 threonine dehydrogenase-like Zn-dependent dehydrogenase [Streptosporangium brasiliense]